MAVLTILPDSSNSFLEQQLTLLVHALDTADILAVRSIVARFLVALQLFPAVVGILHFDALSSLTFFLIHSSIPYWQLVEACLSQSK